MTKGSRTATNSPPMLTDPVETFADNDLVHVHDSVNDADPSFWFGFVLVADEPTSLIAHPRRGMVDILSARVYRAGLTFDGLVCWDCARRINQRSRGR